MSAFFESTNEEQAREFSSRQLRGGTLVQAVLWRSPDVDELRKVLRMACQAARFTAAGLAVSADTQDLLLTQWFPQVQGVDNPEEREAVFLKGLDIWRTALGRVEALSPSPRSERNEVGSLESRVREKMLRPEQSRR